MLGEVIVPPDSKRRVRDDWCEMAKEKEQGQAFDNPRFHIDNRRWEQAVEQQVIDKIQAVCVVLAAVFGVAAFPNCEW
jgi:hypothetical protein